MSEWIVGVYCSGMRSHSTRAAISRLFHTVTQFSCRSMRLASIVKRTNGRPFFGKSSLGISAVSRDQVNRIDSAPPNETEGLATMHSSTSTLGVSSRRCCMLHMFLRALTKSRFKSCLHIIYTIIRGRPPIRRGETNSKINHQKSIANETNC